MFPCMKQTRCYWGQRFKQGFAYWVSQAQQLHVLRPWLSVDLWLSEHAYFFSMKVHLEQAHGGNTDNIQAKLIIQCQILFIAKTNLCLAQNWLPIFVQGTANLLLVTLVRLTKNPSSSETDIILNMMHTHEKGKGISDLQRKGSILASQITINGHVKCEWMTVTTSSVVIVHIVHDIGQVLFFYLQSVWTGLQSSQYTLSLSMKFLPLFYVPLEKFMTDIMSYRGCWFDGHNVTGC